MTDEKTMTTQTIFFSFEMIIHSFNGNAVDVEGFGVIRTKKKETLPEETILALIQLGVELRPICEQMLATGWVFVNGKLVKPEQLKQKV